MEAPGKLIHNSLLPIINYFYIKDVAGSLKECITSEWRSQFANDCPEMKLSTGVETWSVPQYNFHQCIITPPFLRCSFALALTYLCSTAAPPMSYRSSTCKKYYLPCVNDELLLWVEFSVLFCSSQTAEFRLLFKSLLGMTDLSSSWYMGYM